MTIWGMIVLGIVLGVGVIVVIAAVRPATFRIQRRATIAAAPERVFAQINDLVAWQAWSPWAKKDPKARSAFGPKTAGVGATFEWRGNREVGRGRMMIIEAEPSRRMVLRLEFVEPFQATNTTEFTLQPAGSGTEVIWAIFGPQPLPARIMGVFMNMDAMVGKDFEAGLASLRAIAEARG